MINRVLLVLLLLFVSLDSWAQSYIEYYPNGVKKLEGDTFNGPFVYFYETGDVFLKGFTREGIKDSIWNYYNPKKQLAMRETYRGGQLSAKRTWKYYPNGQMGEDLDIAYELFPNRRDTGNVTRNWKFWYEDGAPAASLLFVNGADSSSIYWNRKGDMINREEWLIEMRMEAENR